MLTFKLKIGSHLVKTKFKIISKEKFWGYTKESCYFIWKYQLSFVSLLDIKLLTK